MFSIHIGYVDLLLAIIFFAGPLVIIFLFQRLQHLVDKQIDEEMEKIIPLKGVRDKVKTEIKWR